jgi:glycosyltransferase EpsF
MSTKKPFRVLHITGGMNRGGAETMIMNIYRHMNRELIQFDFVSYYKDKCHYDDEIINMGGRIIYCPPPKETGVLRFIKNLIEIISDKGPFIAVHSHTLHNIGFTLLAARLCNIPKRISHSHSTSDYGSHSFVRNIYFKIARMLIKINATDMVACSKDAAYYLYGYKDSDLVGRVFFLPNAIDLQQYERLDKSANFLSRKQLGISSSTLVLGHVGRFVPVKNHKFFIELASQLKKQVDDFRIVLVGDGPLRSEFEREVNNRNLGENFVFLGIRSDIPFLMNMFDVFLLPSLYEGLPVVLVEAQAAGTPCVVSSTITRESDMGLGLVKFEDIDKVENWISAIKRAINDNNHLPNHVILKKISELGYDVKQNVKILTELYMESL